MYNIQQYPMQSRPPQQNVGTLPNSGATNGRFGDMSFLQPATSRKPKYNLGGTQRPQLPGMPPMMGGVSPLPGGYMPPQGMPQMHRFLGSRGNQGGMYFRGPGGMQRMVDGGQGNYQFPDYMQPQQPPRFMPFGQSQGNPYLPQLT
jgi:hypothetical protein